MAEGIVLDLDQRHHVELWAFAFLTFVVGDTVTTAVGLKSGAVEDNPVGAAVLEQAGVPGMIAIKAGVLGFMFCLYYVFDLTTQWDVDDQVALLMGGLGLLITVWNGYVIFLL